MRYLLNFMCALITLMQFSCATGLEKTEKYIELGPYEILYNSRDDSLAIYEGVNAQDKVKSSVLITKDFAAMSFSSYKQKIVVKKTNGQTEKVFVLGFPENQVEIKSIAGVR